MMKPVLRVDGSNASATDGWPVLDWPKACWNGFMLAVATIGCPLLFSWSAVGLFMAATYASLLVGHSVGMHRMMIHHSFQCSKPVERLLIYAGVLVGVAGPYGIIRIHDTRDWAQRQASCHDFFTHRRSLARDLLWQLAYKFRFDRPPMLKIEPNLADDPWCRFMDRTWRLHQLLPGVVFYAIGGWSWIVWGVCLRVFVSAAGHWTVTYYCHNPGPGRWRVKGAAVQASNIPGLGLITYGECWHNNHHAFPESARIGLEPGQTDPGWLFIRLLRGLGLIRNVGVPRGEGSREDLALASGPAA